MDEYEQIISTNKALYGALGADYADGEVDLQKVKDSGLWQEFLDGLNGKRVLDLGAGVGVAAKELADSGYDVIAADIASSMVAEIKKKAPRIKAIEMNALDVDRLPAEFDGIIAIHLIQHFNKAQLEELFKKIHGQLADGGEFLLVFTNTCYKKTGRQLESDDGTEYIWWHKWLLEDIAPLLADAKFKIVKFQVQKTNSPFIFICKK
ncbi:MAG: class I SAM-dependent methyltransferase [Candidatus Nomurabacteria bacterium]|jgi:cyclopropane fatty-acyl-phospholipid synthase-like methyltransferase|nr:class I SAM-dependent methyltransferase [Candidatus Nomurabacteria bacterium]